jgi:hypothetical protein
MRPVHQIHPVLINQTVGDGNGASIVGKGNVSLWRLTGQEAHKISPTDKAKTIKASHNRSLPFFFIKLIIASLAVFSIYNLVKIKMQTVFTASAPQIKSDLWFYRALNYGLRLTPTVLPRPKIHPSLPVSYQINSGPFHELVVQHD